MEVEDQELYNKARKRVEDIKGFYVHLMVYVLVNIGLFILNWLTSPGHWWFYWALFGWGIGLAFHAIGVFAQDAFFGKDWEDRKIKEIMDKEKNR